MRVQKTVRYLDPMGGLRYTKADLERIVFRQLENLEAMGEKIRLLEKQNELLLRQNLKLKEELGDIKPIVPYPKMVRKRNSGTSPNIAAED